MPEVTAQLNYSIGGVSIASNITRTGTGQISHDLSIANGKLTAGKAGTLTARSGNTAGEATLSDGHGIITNDVVDVFWSGGVQYGCVATVTSDVVALASGAGDNLPSVSTPVIVCKRTLIATAFAGDLIELLAVIANVAGHVDFLDGSNASIVAKTLKAKEAFQITSDTNDDNPLSAASVAKIAVSVNDTGTTGSLQVGVLYDSV